MSNEFYSMALSAMIADEVAYIEKTYHKIVSFKDEDIFREYYEGRYGKVNFQVQYNKFLQKAMSQAARADSKPKSSQLE